MYPKHVRLGFVWFVIVSKLHENLIQGLIFSIAFGALYSWKVLIVLQVGCVQNALHGDWWTCAGMEIKRCSLLIALICHIPAAFLCLIRIRDLDAIIKIMGDIRKLQGIRAIIQDFSRTLQHDGERQALLNAVENRVLTRMKMVQTFFYHIHHIKDKYKNEPSENKVHLREATGVLIDYLEFAADALGKPAEWLNLTEQTWKERVQEITDVKAEVEKRNFRPGGVPGSRSRARGNSVTSSFASESSGQAGAEDSVADRISRSGASAASVRSNASKASVRPRPSTAAAQSNDNPFEPPQEEQPERVNTPPMRPRKLEKNPGEQPLLPMSHGASSHK